MKISIITLFPEIFEPFLNTSIVGRAQKKGLVTFDLVNIRKFGIGVHQIVDDKPFGGGTGMIFKPDVLTAALKSISGWDDVQTTIIVTSASGKTYQQTIARKFSDSKHLIIICGHYEGIDQRFIDKYVHEEISIGDYVLTGGELPALIITDSVIRLVKGVLEKDDATINESFENGLLEHPHYTRPAIFEGMEVPKVLTSGNHQEIENWKKETSLAKTKLKRPDLIK